MLAAVTGTPECRCSPWSRPRWCGLPTVADGRGKAQELQVACAAAKGHAGFRLVLDLQSGCCAMEYGPWFCVAVGSSLTSAVAATGKLKDVRLFFGLMANFANLRWNEAGEVGRVDAGVDG
jgi:hypothetical protein